MPLHSSFIIFFPFYSQFLRVRKIGHHLLQIYAFRIRTILLYLPEIRELTNYAENYEACNIIKRAQKKLSTNAKILGRRRWSRKNGSFAENHSAQRVVNMLNKRTYNYYFSNYLILNLFLVVGKKRNLNEENSLRYAKRKNQVYNEF